jgi:nuclear GTP-binding protein
MVGYPNTGKSSIINTLRKKKVCVVAPIAGETKVWQYITLMKRIYMIDCPGIVPPNQNDTDEDLLLRGSVRVENVEYPAQYIPAVIRRVQPRHLQRTYDIKDYNDDSVTFLEILCRKSGRLLKGGEADIDGAAKMVLNDWYVSNLSHIGPPYSHSCRIRGKIPWFTPPPYKEGEAAEPVKGVEGREGRLGEMGKKRKRGAGSEATDSIAATTDATGAPQDEDEDDEDDEFSGFSGDEELQFDEEEDDEEDEADTDEEGGTLLEAPNADTDSDVNDDDVEAEVAAISQVLSKAKKRQRTT